jgi:hypothetical protein
MDTAMAICRASAEGFVGRPQVADGTDDATIAVRMMNTSDGRRP